MTDDSTTEQRPAGTGLVGYVAQAEPLQRRADVRHDPSYVTQLIANAADLPNMPQRRRSDRLGPLAAYAARPSRAGQVRRIA